MDCLIFATMTPGACHREKHLRDATLGMVPAENVNIIYLVRDERSSLFGYLFSHEETQFCNIDKPML